ncbi:hypothetical protein [Virgibacillus litoralis]|uniref:N-acetyltransferase domain-containing protein n=1 Tax=Virgibacillus litoralis TaxID=578221 RepID=A0ABS4HIW0_9BACI|nr:hypothetical protein [Virgibacillus litoralis]MBP1950861.1 hypothetical protein [Virgibacillus litoralis]
MIKIHVTTATAIDIRGMLELNYKIYPEEWHVSAAYVEYILRANKDVYRVVKTGSDVKGIYSLFPFSKVNYEEILNGSLEEKKLGQYILDYDQEKEVYLYLISFIVDIYDNNSREYTKALLADMTKQLPYLASKGITINEIGAIGISDDGNRILERIGFTKEKLVDVDGEKYPVFRVKVKTILDAILI